MVRTTLKRPAGVDGGQKTFSAWAEEYDKSPDHVVAIEDDKPDTTTITPQQRHVFKKCIDKLPGMPGAAPQEVQEAWQAACAAGPKAKAAIVNSLIPRDATYSHAIDFDSRTLEVFTKKFSKKTKLNQARGRSYTQLKADLGHGEIGAQAIKDGLAANDIQEKDGLYFMREELVAVLEGTSDSSRVKGTRRVDAETWNDTVAELGAESWAQFAFNNKRQLALTNGESSKSKPPTQEAQLMLEEAYEKIQKSIKGVRNHAMMIMRGSPSEGTQATIKLALDKCTVTEQHELAELSDMLCTQVKDMCDEDVKSLLRKVAKPYAVRPQYEQDSSALTRSRRSAS